MRLIITIAVLLITATGCGTAKKAASTNGALNGTWAPIKEQMGDRALPEAMFRNQRLTISDSIYTLVAESTDKGIVRYNGGKMDIYGKEGVNAGKHFTALYKYDGSQLTICYNLAGDSYPENFDAKGKPLFFLAVFGRGSNINNAAKMQHVQQANFPDK